MTGALTSESIVACFLFFDHQGILHYEFAPDVQIINQDFYQTVLRSLWNMLRRKRPEMWSAESWLLCHDNETARSRSIVN
jgi:hypothetical protein